MLSAADYTFVSQRPDQVRRSRYQNCAPALRVSVTPKFWYGFLCLGQGLGTVFQVARLSSMVAGPAGPETLTLARSDAAVPPTRLARAWVIRLRVCKPLRNLFTHRLYVTY